MLFHPYKHGTSASLPRELPAELSINRTAGHNGDDKEILEAVKKSVGRLSVVSTPEIEAACLKLFPNLKQVFSAGNFIEKFCAENSVRKTWKEPYALIPTSRLEKLTWKFLRNRVNECSTPQNSLDAFSSVGTLTKQETTFRGQEVRTDISVTLNDTNLFEGSLEKLDGDFKKDLITAVKEFALEIQKREKPWIPLVVTDAKRRTDEEQAEDMLNLYPKRLANIYVGRPTQILTVLDHLMIDNILLFKKGTPYVQEMFFQDRPQELQLFKIKDYLDDRSGDETIKEHLYNIWSKKGNAKKEEAKKLLLYMMKNSAKYGNLSQHRFARAIDISQYSSSARTQNHPYLERLKDHIKDNYKGIFSTSSTEHYAHLHIQYRWGYEPKK